MPWEIYGGSGPWISVEQGLIWLDDMLLRKAHCVRQPVL